MAWKQTTGGGFRRLLSEGFWTPSLPISMTWQVFVDSLGAPDFGTMVALGPTTFNGTDYFVAFHDKLSVPQKWAMGIEGIDVLGSAVTTGRWYHQALRGRVDGTGYVFDFFPDLPGTEVITNNTGAGFSLDFIAGHEMYFGKVPWGVGEFLNGRMMGMKIWQAFLPQGALAREALSVWPVVPQYAARLWALLPGRTPVDSHDLSGHGRHFTPVGTLTGIGDAPITVPRPRSMLGSLAAAAGITSPFAGGRSIYRIAPQRWG